MATTEPSLHRDALLLLPPPTSTCFSSLKAAYGPAISTLLPTLSRTVRGTSHSVVLDIAIATTCGLRAPESQPRSRSFARLQELLAAFYRLLGVLSASESVELDGPGGVDARVFFLDCRAGDGGLQCRGPIVGLEEVTASRRSWDTVYFVGTEQGDVLLQQFIQAQGQRSQTSYASNITKLPGTQGSQEPAASLVDEAAPQRSPHYSVAVGGTFDHLHAGHKLLLTATVLAVDPLPANHHSSDQRVAVTIGITGDELLVNKKYAEFLESWEERWRGVWDFLRSVVDFTPPDRRDIKVERVSNPGPNGKYVVVTVSPALDFRFVQIADPFGPTITDQAITSLVVSKETRAGGKAVNDEREKKGWAPLEVFEVDVLELGEELTGENGASKDSFEAKISSTEIRRRRMNLAKGSL